MLTLRAPASCHVCLGDEPARTACPVPVRALPSTRFAPRAAVSAGWEEVVPEPLWAGTYDWSRGGVTSECAHVAHWAGAATCWCPQVAVGNLPLPSASPECGKGLCKSFCCGLEGQRIERRHTPSWPAGGPAERSCLCSDRVPGHVFLKPQCRLSGRQQSWLWGLGGIADPIRSLPGGPAGEAVRPTPSLE